MESVWQKAEAGWYRTPVDKDGELWIHLRHDGRRLGWSIYVSDDRFSYRKNDLRYSALLDLLEALEKIEALAKKYDNYSTNDPRIYKTDENCRGIFGQIAWIARAALTTAPSRGLVEAAEWQKVLAEIGAERRRQVEEERWSPSHDDEHDLDQLASAAACYALPGRHRKMVARDDDGDSPPKSVPQLWPWATAWWKPKGRRRDLVRAAALIVAEIERLDRTSAKGGAG